MSIPVLVAGPDASAGEFAEETRTLVVNRGGALILLKHSLRPDDQLRIFNLISDAAADFRVVGPTSAAHDGSAEWGVEYLKDGMNIWGIDFPPGSEEDKAHASALLECQGCTKKFFWPLTLVEIEVLESTGVIQNFCSHCDNQTSWIHADPAHRPAQLPLLSNAQPQTDSGDERREKKRLLMRLPIMVRNQKGETESTQTENMSQADLAVSLELKLAVGDYVTVVCPLTDTGRNLERSAKVLRKDSFSAKDRVLYGLRFASAPQAGN
ncbi:MAG TPA: PilZ domain-containing protein [Terriglobia bacterium]|nr:PilZ domain-containing protein [Terriglobia bacterium]